jgi:hypothetical protein
MNDPLLRRVERRALLFAAAAAGAAWLVPGGGWRAAAGVAGGAALVGVSYWAIHTAVTGLTRAAVAQANTGKRARRGLFSLILRYALLAGMAYVMIARLRLPPIALLIGASAMVVAAGFELAGGSRRS